MTDFRHKIALIVPTRNRPELLVKLLQNLQDQTVQANQVIVVDGSDQPVEAEIKQFLSPSVSYMHVFPPSLAKQRNEGLKALDKDITLVGYLDDDILLEKDAVEAMLRFWEHCPDDIGGSSFTITNVSRISLFGKLLGKVFCFDDYRQGVVLRSGFSTAVSPVLKDTYTEWLCGGATVWRRQIFEEFKYDQWFVGWAYLEDVDFSFTVAQRYRLIVIKDAKVQHLPPPFDPKKRHSLGRAVVQQRYHFVRKHTQLSLPLFYWATLGQALAHILASIRRWNSSEILMAFGGIAGLLDVIRGNIVQIDTQFRKNPD